MEPKYKPWDYVYILDENRVVLCLVYEVRIKLSGTYHKPAQYIQYTLRYDPRFPSAKYQGTGEVREVVVTDGNVFSTKEALLASL